MGLGEAPQPALRSCPHPGLINPRQCGRAASECTPPPGDHSPPPPQPPLGEAHEKQLPRECKSPGRSKESRFCRWRDSWPLQVTSREGGQMIFIASLHVSVSHTHLILYRLLVTNDILSHLISQHSKDRWTRHYYPPFIRQANELRGNVWLFPKVS